MLNIGYLILYSISRAIQCMHKMFFGTFPNSCTFFNSTSRTVMKRVLNSNRSGLGRFISELSRSIWLEMCSFAEPMFSFSASYKWKKDHSQRFDPVFGLICADGNTLFSKDEVVVVWHANRNVTHTCKEPVFPVVHKQQRAGRNDMYVLYVESISRGDRCC